MIIYAKESFIGFSKEAVETACKQAVGKSVTIESDGPKVGEITKATVIEESGNNFVVEFEMEAKDLWI